MEELLDSISKAEEEHEAIRPLMEKLRRAIDGDVNVNLVELQQELEQYINITNLDSFEGLKEDLENIHSQLVVMNSNNNQVSMDSNSIIENPTEAEEISTTEVLTEEPIVTETPISEQITENLDEVNERDKNQIINAMNNLIESGERLTISVVGTSNVNESEASRTININQVSFTTQSIEYFDNVMLPAVYDAFYNGKNPEVITDTDDLKNGRFMATSSNGDSMVVIDLPTNVLENINNHALEVTRTMPAITEVKDNTLNNNNEVKAKTKVKTMNINEMGFVGSMSIGMIIGAIIVIIILILMLLGLIRV